MREASAKNPRAIWLPEPEQPSTPSVGSRGRPRDPLLEVAAELEQEAANRRKVSELHARFGENAARQRVLRARSQQREERQRRRTEAEAKEQEAEKHAAAAEDFRRRAACRAASELRGKAEEQQREEERRFVEETLRRERGDAAGRHYAMSTRRRATSERSSRDASAREVLSDLHSLQAERREAGDAKALELQRCCRDADFGHCASAVKEKLLHAPSRQPASELFAMDKGGRASPGAVAGRQAGTLPQVPLSAAGSRPPKAPRSVQKLHLPRLAVA